MSADSRHELADRTGPNSTSPIRQLGGIGSSIIRSGRGYQFPYGGLVAKKTSEKQHGATLLPSTLRSGAEEITEWDQQTYLKLISVDLTPEQENRITHTDQIYPRQEAVLAVHWHPEFVPLQPIRQRLQTMFPSRQTELIIPTQHNILQSYDDFSGVEVDCYSTSFNRKVQLLIHFHRPRIDQADVFKSMLLHTFQYRSRQLFEFIETIINPLYEKRLQRAADITGADEDLVEFTRLHTVKLKKLYLRNEGITPAQAIKNKLLSQYFETLIDLFDEHLVHHALLLLRSVKEIVKANFNLEYFYQTEEIIEEVRALGGGIVIPHPEQFWPILLAEYDVDGYEVWNPQSRDYTEFLIQVVDRQNRSPLSRKRPLLIFMGDDCHMGEKVKEPRYQDPEKAGREVGVQPAWDDLAIRKSLIVANCDRRTVIEEYRQRLLA
ncbi:MAG: hypothetical protein HJJLKODD_02794 [Phycisphaerae bacterium]|nr:hypothetical protein [Phycisphaerae bacterium]